MKSLRRTAETSRQRGKRNYARYYEQEGVPCGNCPSTVGDDGRRIAHFMLDVLARAHNLASPFGRPPGLPETRVEAAGTAHTSTPTEMGTHTPALPGGRRSPI
jgi:hypothetical protein